MVPRSPQGQPVIVQAGQSDAGRELAARTAEVLFTVPQNLDTARAFYADLKERTAKCGRSPDSIKIMPGVLTVVGEEPRRGAGEVTTALQEMIHPELGVRGAVRTLSASTSRAIRWTGRCPTCRCPTPSRAARRW